MATHTDNSRSRQLPISSFVNWQTCHSHAWHSTGNISTRQCKQAESNKINTSKTKGIPHVITISDDNQNSNVFFSPPGEGWLLGQILSSHAGEGKPWLKKPLLLDPSLNNFVTSKHKCFASPKKYKNQKVEGLVKHLAWVNEQSEASIWLGQITTACAVSKPICYNLHPPPPHVEEKTSTDHPCTAKFTPPV